MPSVYFSLTSPRFKVRSGYKCCLAQFTGISGPISYSLHAMKYNVGAYMHIPSISYTPEKMVKVGLLSVLGLQLGC